MTSKKFVGALTIDNKKPSRKKCFLEGCSCAYSLLKTRVCSTDPNKKVDIHFLNKNQ